MRKFGMFEYDFKMMRCVITNSIDFAKRTACIIRFLSRFSRDFWQSPTRHLAIVALSIVFARKADILRALIRIIKSVQISSLFFLAFDNAIIIYNSDKKIIVTHSFIFNTIMQK